MSAAMPLRAAAIRQLRRRRTTVSFGLLAALPLVLVAAFALGDPPDPNAATTTFVDLARQSGANFTVFALFATSGFMLTVLAALFIGDPVPSEANWSSLRYLLIAPVPRSRLLSTTLIVGMSTLAVALAGFLAWSLLVGGIAYGWGPYSTPFGARIGWNDLWWRLLVILGYQLVVLAQVGALAFLFGTITDSPLGAVGGAVVVTIVAAILDQIEALAGIRDGLPMHFQFAWTDLLRPAADWSDVVQGVAWAVIYTVPLVAAGYWQFNRKDVLS